MSDIMTTSNQAWLAIEKLKLAQEAGGICLIHIPEKVSRAGEAGFLVAAV
jgi:hypothetical protein